MKPASRTSTLASQGSTSARRYVPTLPSNPGDCWPPDGCGLPGDGLSCSYAVTDLRADWATATTAVTKAAKAAGDHAAPVPKPRSSRTVFSAPECGPESH